MKLDSLLTAHQYVSGYLVPYHGQMALAQFGVINTSLLGLDRYRYRVSADTYLSIGANNSPNPSRPSSPLPWLRAWHSGHWCKRIY